MTIYIVNPMNDVHCRHMISKMKERGLEYKELGSMRLNDYALLNGELFYNGELLSDVRSVYFRSMLTQDPNQPVYNKVAEQYISQVQFSAQVEAIRAWLKILHEERIRVINPPTSSSKYYQLYALQRAGVPLPRTCITSNPSIAKGFIQEVKKAVCKPLPGGSYCRKVTPELLDKLNAIHAEPTIFQEEIPGDDIRVNMLAGEVISAHKIMTSSPDVLDYRTDPNYDAGQTQYAEVKLPENVIRYCQAAMDVLGLRFSGIDLRRTPEGEYILIECNSMPAFLDIELKTGAPITDRLIDDLQQAANVSRQSFNNSAPGVIPGYSRKEVTDQFASLFNYYEVMTAWRMKVEKHKDRIIVDLNEEQKQQMLEETGGPKTQMELEIKEGKVRVLRVW